MTDVAEQQPMPERWPEIPREHRITRLYLLPAGAAAEFMAELEDETEEPTPELRALLYDHSR
jgi:hypothetical protein